MGKLKTQVQTFRNAARDIARMHKIESAMEVRAEYRKDKDAIMKDLEHLNKNIAMVEYNIDKLDKACPIYDKQLTEEQDNLKYFKEAIESKTKTIADLDEKLAKISKKIDDIESGESKVSIDDVNNTTHEIINGLTDSVAEKAGDVDIDENDK